ncbi:hypothetical protein [Frankia sp. Cas3]|uniref:hypothetical protein n=1 Tax=Frankia sp. Cas3 TaxID=3073926 RepID=UPI002AD353E2|nr:hypothetical protein [Frankia sp. Cas3]
MSTAFCNRGADTGYRAPRGGPRPAVERLLTCRDVPLREKTLWRMLYETAGRAAEILALDIPSRDD